MIKFFRKIRQNLLSQGKTGRDFKYAIGEIVLVVIGILIALQINDWNENRKQQIKEREILSYTIKNLTVDSLAIDRLITNAERILKVHEELVQLSKGEIQESDVSDLDMFRYSESSQIITKKNNIDLPNQISNTALKEAILRYFIWIDYVEFTTVSQIQFVAEQLSPFFREKKLLNYLENSATAKAKAINRERFFIEFKNEEFKQILFDSRGRSNNLKRLGLKIQSKNAELLQAVKKYLDEQ
jgi:hypothetical protein